MAKHLKKTKKNRGKRGKPRLIAKYITFKKLFFLLGFLVLLTFKLLKFLLRMRWWLLLLMLISVVNYCLFCIFLELESLKDKSFAESLHIQSHDSILESEIRNKIKRLKSRRPAYKREEFLSHLKQFLKKNTRIDKYWIRLGLDNALYVKFTLNYGAFIITNNRKNYLVSHNHKIIKSKVNFNDFPHLISIEIPNISIKKEKVYYETNRPLNLFWLQENSLKISRYVKRNLRDYKIETLSWEEEVGYSLSLNKKVDETNKLKVFLGQTLLEAKLKRLLVILKDVKKRKMAAVLINIRNYNSPVLKLKDKKKNSNSK